MLKAESQHNDRRFYAVWVCMHVCLNQKLSDGKEGVQWAPIGHM